jgi:Uroporphyrinogen-III decarboxylase
MRDEEVNRVNSKEIVKRAIEFRNPERVPYNFDNCRTVPIETKYGDDFQWVNLDPDPEFVPKVFNDEEYENEWKVIYKRMGKTLGEPHIYPIDDINKVYTYKTPDLSADYRFHSAIRLISENSDKYVLGTLGLPGTNAFIFMLMIDLFGFENFMLNIGMYPEEVEYLADRITEEHLKTIDRYSTLGIDGVIAGEDLGVQDRLIISPNMWRRIFKPRYERIIRKAHSKGMHVMLHICGYILDILDDLIEIGLDVVQIDQQDNMGIDNLGEKYGGKICFFCPVDIQTTLMGNDRAKVEKKAIQLMKAFGRKGGGFIAKIYPQPEALNIPEENVKLMCEVFKKYGKYPLSMV